MNIGNFFKKSKVLRTPTILQMEATECGAASLGMVMAYHKLFVPLEKLRTMCGVSRDGSNALNIVKAAEAYGFEAAGYKCELDDLDVMELPAILHWEFNHFVVFEGKQGNYFYINDPASGRRKVTYDEFDRSFTGLLLQLIPTDNFKAGGAPESLTKALLSRLKNVKASLFYIVICSILMAIPGIIIPTGSEFS
jgi:ABC-type bacteriocin/lantibiotic exporter with double-glycine peptidase domain